MAAVKKILIFTVPLLILAGALLFIPRIALLSPAHRELLVIAPYLAAVTGMFLAVHFHRGRPFTALLLISLFYYVYKTFLQFETSGFAFQAVYYSFAMLLPFNFVMLALMRERGILSTAGRLRFMALLIQAFLAWFVCRHYGEGILPPLTRKIFQTTLFDSLLLPQPVMFFAMAMLLVVAALTVRRQAPVESGLMGALAALLIALLSLGNQEIPATFCTAAALIITLSILQDSYNMAFRDDLTGIPSRRALNESLHGLGRRYVIAMLDVDHFKKFNDTYGHDVGDQVLKMVAKKMFDVRGGGKAYRYGGEEFTILFSGKRLADALPHLEEVRRVIEEYRLSIRNNDRPKDEKQGESKRGSKAGTTEVSVTVSIGVAESGDEQRTAAEVIKAADKALYRAKSRGRNQVCC